MNLTAAKNALWELVLWSSTCISVDSGSANGTVGLGAVTLAPFETLC